MWKGSLIQPYQLSTLKTWEGSHGRQKTKYLKNELSQEATNKAFSEPVDNSEYDMFATNTIDVQATGMHIIIWFIKCEPYNKQDR